MGRNLKTPGCDSKPPRGESKPLPRSLDPGQRAVIEKERKRENENRGEFGELVGMGRGRRSLDRCSQDACMKDLFCVRALPLRALITQ